MLLSSLTLLVAAVLSAQSAPAGSSGGAPSSSPELKDSAVTVPLPIDRVMVFSDRARVTRTGSVKLGGGVTVLRAPDLPGGVLPESIRVTTTGAKLVRVESQPVERERWSIDQVDAWLAQLETTGDEMNKVNGALGSLREELQLLSSLRAAPPVPEKDRLGKPAPALATDGWRGLQGHLMKRRQQLRQSELAAERALRSLQEKYQAAQREVSQRDVGGFTDTKWEVLVLVEGKGNATVELEYAVPGAFWKPAYELGYEPEGGTGTGAIGGSVELRAAGLVTQATGEDWENARILLSTAVPGQGIALPELMTWTLGDDREYVPRPYARGGPRTTRPFAPPAPRPRLVEIEREADRAVLQRRSQQLLAMLGQPGTGAAYDKKTVIDFSGVSIDGELSKPEGAYVRNRQSAAPAMPSAAPPPEPAPAMAMDEDLAYTESDQMEEVARAPAATTSMFGGVRAAGPGGDGGLARRGLALRSQPIPQKPQFSDPRLPAVAAGGLDYVYDAPVRVTVPSQAESLRVPLAARRYEVQTFYEATPSLAKTAYLKASVKNGSKLPILAGPANVFVKRAFAGEADLMTTGPGGVLELPLGADEDIRLTHTVVPQTKTQGFLFGEQDVTDYTVKIEVGNYKKHPITLRVIDQLPKTNHEKLKVELVSQAPKATAAPDADGLLAWNLDVKAGQTQTVTFSYRITRPKGWKVSQ